LTFRKKTAPTFQGRSISQARNRHEASSKQWIEAKYFFEISVSSKELTSVIYHKIEMFIITAVLTSNTSSETVSSLSQSKFMLLDQHKILCSTYVGTGGSESE
jgi:hypothetical protein